MRLLQQIVLVKKISGSFFLMDYKRPPKKNIVLIEIKQIN